MMRRSLIARPVLMLTLGLACAIVGALPSWATTTPSLGGGSLMPGYGDTNTNWIFSITCYGEPEPTSHDLYLDGSVFVMKYSGVVGNNVGRLYMYQTKLRSGTHKYRYSFKVGTTALYKPGPTAATWYTSPKVNQTESYTVSGQVKTGTAAVADVDIRLTKVSSGETARARTGSDGRFTAKSLAPGKWVVEPSKTGYTFGPTSKTITVPPNTSSCNFTATRTK